MNDDHQRRDAEHNGRLHVDMPEPARKSGTFGCEEASYHPTKIQKLSALAKINTRLRT
jgi:hypothetical protein